MNILPQTNYGISLHSSGLQRKPMYHLFKYNWAQMNDESFSMIITLTLITLGKGNLVWANTYDIRYVYTSYYTDAMKNAHIIHSEQTRIPLSCLEAVGSWIKRTARNNTPGDLQDTLRLIREHNI